MMTCAMCLWCMMMMVVVVLVVGSLSQNSSRNFGKSMYSQSTATKHPFRLRSVIFQTIKFEIEFVEYLFQFVLFPWHHRPTLRFIFLHKSYSIRILVANCWNEEVNKLISVWSIRISWILSANQTDNETLNDKFD